MRTTIKDIANYTGFSVTTISLVLNNKANKIPKSTKDTILEAVESSIIIQTGLRWGW
ncbi:MAG: LacI family DNA-binding transcriptional regulator [Sellimonas intestinalis]